LIIEHGGSLLRPEQHEDPVPVASSLGESAQDTTAAPTA
jgi:hypothetical protein